MSAPKIQPTSILSRKKNVLFSNLDGELLGLDSEAGYVYSMNETSSRIWDLIETPISFDALCTQLATEFDIDAETCRNEVQNLLQKLVEADLVDVG